MKSQENKDLKKAGCEDSLDIAWLLTPIKKNYTDEDYRRVSEALQAIKAKYPKLKEL